MKMTSVPWAGIPAASEALPWPKAIWSSVLTSFEPDCQVLTVSEEGFGKRNNIDAYKVQLRGGKGIKNFKITPKTGDIVGVEVVHEGQELMLITSNGIVIRTDIESIGIKKGRNTSGVKIQKLEGDDKVAALDTIAIEGNDEDEKEQTKLFK